MRLIITSPVAWLLVVLVITPVGGQENATQRSGNPADQLPPHIGRLTWFGERADWSHDGRRILFLSKTFGDAMEIDVESRVIRNLTAHYPHHGYTRALYLANGDILFSGPKSFDPERPVEAREQCYLWVLDRDARAPAVSLETKCSEGPAVSRSRMRIAWTHLAVQYPEERPRRLPSGTSESEESPAQVPSGRQDLHALPRGGSRMLTADVEYADGRPRLAHQTVIIEGNELGFRCTPETQNFRPPDEKELIFSAYGHQGTDVCGVNLETKQIVNYSDAPNQYDEPEGIYPDGQFTLVECDRQNRRGPNHVDLWKLALDGSGAYERLTYFSDYPGFKASNPVVSDDGRFIAFQLAMSRDAAGVGHGIFLYDVEAARQSRR